MFCDKCGSKVKAYSKSGTKCGRKIISVLMLILVIVTAAL